MYVTPPFSHACSAFAVALFITVWLRVRDSWSPAGAAWLGADRRADGHGARAGHVLHRRSGHRLRVDSACPSRPKAQGPGPRLDTAMPGTQHLALEVAHPAPGTQHPAPGERRARHLGPRTAITAALVGAVTFLLAFAPQLLAYNSLNGHPSPTELVERKMIWTSPHALEVLFSPAHGLFAWTPLALLALSGVVLLALGHTRGAASGSAEDRCDSAGDGRGAGLRHRRRRFMDAPGIVRPASLRWADANLDCRTRGAVRSGGGQPVPARAPWRRPWQFASGGTLGSSHSSRSTAWTASA